MRVNNATMREKHYENIISNFIHYQPNEKK